MTLYIFENIANRKVYIGQTLMHFNNRWLKHLSDARRGCSTRFARAMNKYGANSFRLIFQLQLDSREEANEAEVFLISMFNATNHCFGYNIQKGGHKFGTHTEETKRKMSLAHMGKVPYNKGLHHTLETRAKLSAIGKGKPKPAGHGAKVSAALKGRRPSLECMRNALAASTNRVQTPEEKSRRKLTWVNPMLGKHHTAETKAKIGAANRGHIAPLSQRLAVAESNRRRAKAKSVAA